jgi:hypothetical protein
MKGPRVSIIRNPKVLDVDLEEGDWERTLTFSLREKKESRESVLGG